MSREKDLEFLRQNFSYLFQLFVVIKELRGTGREKIAPNLHKVLLSSVVRNFILGLANLLDPVVDKQGNENISIRVIDIDLSKYAEVIEKIRTFRSKAIAHNDRTVMHIGDDFFTGYNLRPEQVEELFEYMLSSLEKELQNPFPRDKAVEEVLPELKRLLQ